MRIPLRRYRRGAVVASTVVGSVLIALAMAVPAGASTVAASNFALNGAGSNTTYTMMQQLSDLYNSAPGCNLLTANSAAQELNYACASSYSTAAPGDENGYNLTYSPINPYNDVVWQEPALGSSNGIKELELEGADTPGSAPDNLIAASDFARSSRAAVTSGTGDDKAGLNFVAYAQDAVPWLVFSKTTGGGACATTPGGTVPAAGLTTSQLAGIYEGTITNWSTVGGGNGPINVFIAQSGSGTEGTWATDLGLTGTYPYGGVTATATRLGLPASDFEIFENEVSDIWSLNNANASKKIACDAIFFFSYGKFSLLCPAGACSGTPSANTGSVAKLGEIGGVKASKKTIQNGSFALDRQLYNVYSDGSNSNLPFAGSPQPKEGQAVMNFVSTYGFLCSPTTHNAVDPLSPTGETYGTEIDNIITANGFYPFKLGVEGDSGIATPPDFTDAGYAAASPTPAGDNGYCRVTTTDGDGNN
jgi:ABC-type phosphate transport system substrate-binding protein